MAMFSPTVMCGKRPDLLDHVADPAPQLDRRQLAMLRPSIRMSPSSNGISRLTSLSAVVLPPPEGPTSTQNVPAGIVKRELLERGALASGVALRDAVEDDLGRGALMSPAPAVARRTRPSDAGRARHAAGGEQPGRDRHRRPVPGEVELVRGAGDRRAHDGDPEQARHPRNGVVDARGDARVSLACVGEDGGRQRRDDQRRPTEKRRSGGRSCVQ